MLQAIHETAVHNEVHTAVAAYLLGLCLILGNERILVFLFETLDVLLRKIIVTRHLIVGRLDTNRLHLITRQRISLNRILVGKTFRANNLVHAVVRLRGHRVVLHLNHLTVLCADERYSVVTIGESITLLARHLLNPRLAINRLGIHSDQSLHAVAAMNVKHLGNGAKAVSCIDVATVLLVVVETPA